MEKIEYILAKKNNGRYTYIGLDTILKIHCPL